MTGASGYIGGRLTPDLQKAGFRNVVGMARDPEKLERRNWKGIEIVQGDALMPESLDRALSGIDVAFYLIHSMTSSGKSFAKHDIQCAKNFAEACERQGVKRIIYLGGLGSTGMGLSKHLQSRQDTGDALRSTSVPVTELRSAIVIGSGSASFEIIKDLVHKLPIMICPRWVSSKCEPISIRQLVQYLIGVINEPRSIGQILDVGSGEVLTYADMLRQCGEVIGQKVTIIPVPILSPRISSYWLNLVTSVPIGLAKTLVESLRNDVICHDFRIRKWIKVDPITYRDAVSLALAKQKAGTYESRWTDATTSKAAEIMNYKGLSFVDERRLEIDASPEKIFKILKSVGGSTGWFHADWLWQLRASMDWLIGGVGMRRGRPHPDNLSVGDTVDFWRVERLITNKHIAFRAEMKLPGQAMLIFDITEKGAVSVLIMKACFWPSGFWGKLYWYCVLPLHNYVFEGMLDGIRGRAEIVAKAT